MSSSTPEAPVAGDGVFRAGTVQPLCARCHLPSAGALCPRCGLPFCAEHAPKSDQRCADCEDAFAVLRGDRKLNPLATWMLLAACAISASLVALVGRLLAPYLRSLWVTGVLVLVCLLAGAMPLCFVALRRRRLRRRFLEERPAHRVLRLSAAGLRSEKARLLDPGIPKQRVAPWVLAGIATAYGIGSAGYAAGAALTPALALAGPLLGITALVLFTLWATRDRIARLTLVLETFSLVLLPAWGLLLNHQLPRCNPAGCDPLFQFTNRPLSLPGAYWLAAIYAATVLAYTVARRRPERLRPLPEVLVLAQLALGILLCLALALHLHLGSLLAVASGPFGLPLATPLVAGTLFSVTFIRRLLRRGREARPEPLHTWAALATLPLLGLWSMLERLLLGEWPLDAFTKVCSSDWLFATLRAPTRSCGGHYLCTVAARGHRWLVRPLRLGRRGGEPILVNRQLAVANAFEDLLHQRWPRFGRLCRRIYDRLALPLAQQIRRPIWADIIYLAMKPLEWLFALALLLLDPGDPEARVDRMYR